MTEAALYRLLGRDGDAELFESTPLTEGPWGPIQHGGPVAAILGRALDRHEPRPGTRLSRVTIELLGPVPISQVRVRTHIERPGRKIELLGAELDALMPDGQWRRCATGSAWRLACQDTSDVVWDAAKPQQLLDDASPSALAELFPSAWLEYGFVGTIDWRISRRSHTPGEPTLAWTDLRCAVVEGEEPSPLERLLAVSDTANGVGARLDPTQFAFLNTELTVHLHQAPTGRWVGIEAETSVGADGIANSSGILHAESGPVGRVNQSVLVERITS